jgi:Trypsin-co-occurring domain 1
MLTSPLVELPVTAERGRWQSPPEEAAMMQTVEVPLAGGGSVLVEVDELAPAQALRGRGGTMAPPSLTEPLEQVLSGLGPATRAVLEQFHELADSPHEIEIEFAVKLTADARIVIAHVGGEANFRIALKWARPQNPSPPTGGGI